MATNPASYNPIGEETGPVSGPPPQVSSETQAALKQAADDDASSGTGQHAAGRDAGSKVGTAGAGKEEEQEEVGKVEEK